MSRLRKRGEAIRSFILANVEQNPQTVVALAAAEFGVSRQAINKHIKRLVDQGALVIQGSTRSKIYQLSPLLEWSSDYQITHKLAEDRVWDADIRHLVSKLPDNVRDILTTILVKGSFLLHVCSIIS